MRNVVRNEFIRSIPIVFIATAATWCAADEIPRCRFAPTGVSAFSRLDKASPLLVHALTERVGEVVPVGAPFDSTDVIVTGKNRRLIFIWNRGTRWVVATEHGGRGYNDPVFAFEIDERGNKIDLVREEIAFPDSVCSTALSLLVIGYPPYISGPPRKPGAR
jgi:hypothetical protein